MTTNERIRLLRERMLRTPEICTERARWMTASYRRTEGEPEVIRRALAFRCVLEHLPVRLLEGELLAGLPTSKIRGGALTPELNAAWYARELDELSTREWDRFSPIGQEDREIIRDICGYWDGSSLYDRWKKRIPVELLDFNNLIQVGGAFCGNNQYYGHISIDYECVLQKGLLSIREQAQALQQTLDLSDPEQLNRWQYLRAVIIALDGAVLFAQRYAACVAELAEQETEPLRKAELTRLAGICAKVPLSPAETFYEAVQAVCMTYTLLMIEAPGTGEGYLRADQYLYPYYCRDMEAGTLDRDFALALVASLYVKLNASVIPYSSEVVAAFCGFALSANITLGGLDASGSNAVNELTWLFLDAEELVALVAEDIVIRVHKSTPMDFLVRAGKLARKLRGKIKFVGDRTIIGQLTAAGRPAELACGYAITGCNTPTLPGRSLDTPGGIINLPLLLELALNNGVMRLTGKKLGPETGDPRSFHSFEQVWEAFCRQAEALIPLCTVYKNTDKQLYAEYAQQPFQSALMHGTLERGRDLTDGGTDYTSFSMSLAGAPNVGDSLASIKKLVFEEKYLTMAELLDALDRNFAGKEELLHRIEQVPRFGNNLPYVDTLVDRVLKTCSAIATRQKGWRGADSGAAAASITANIGLGEIVGALPDGRLAGTPISEGGISPHQGRNISGPTATMMSVAHLDNRSFTNGAVLNMRFSADLLKNESDYLRFAQMILAYLEAGGVLVQFNFVDTETLMAARKNPDSYRDLLVRVATFTSYFVELSPPLQDDIINRLEFRSL